jgi:uncharacterized protein YdhG (YjbR/CyaY superfamily)
MLPTLTRSQRRTGRGAPGDDTIERFPGSSRGDTSFARGSSPSDLWEEGTMAEKQPAQRATKKPAKSTAVRHKTYEGFTDEERAAMKEYAQELKAAGRRGARGAADGERDVLAKIAEMSEPDRSMAERLHAIVKASAPVISPRTWYGMPAYAKDGNVVCFFQPAQKFKSRYATFGFSDKANLDEGAVWPVAFALKELTADEEARIAALVKRAVS